MHEITHTNMHKTHTYHVLMYIYIQNQIQIVCERESERERDVNKLACAHVCVSTVVADARTRKHASSTAGFVSGL